MKNGDIPDTISYGVSSFFVTSNLPALEESKNNITSIITYEYDKANRLTKEKSGLR